DMAVGEPVRIEQCLRVAFTAIAQQADDAAALAACAHRCSQLQAGHEVGAGRAAVATAEQFLQQPGGRDRRAVRYLDDVVDHVEQKAGFHPRPADTLDQGGLAGYGVRVARAPAMHETAAGRFGHAKTRVQSAVAQVAADRGRGAAGAGAADDPRRLRFRLQRELADDRFGDVVVAAPVGGALGQAELVQVQAPREACSAARACTRVGSSTRSHSPPSAWTSRILPGAVHAGITAMKCKPSMRANHASEMAVLPDEASTTVWPSRRRPLHSAYRYNERARRCLRLPLGWLASSLK